MIFGRRKKNKIQSEIESKEPFSEESDAEFKNEMKEILENKSNEHLSEEDIKIEEEINEIESKNVDDDLLQIPAFLRRQAN